MLLVRRRPSVAWAQGIELLGFLRHRAVAATSLLQERLELTPACGSCAALARLKPCASQRLWCTVRVRIVYLWCTYGVPDGVTDGYGWVYGSCTDRERTVYVWRTRPVDSVLIG